MLNYVFIVTIFPALLMVLHRYAWGGKSPQSVCAQPCRRSRIDVAVPSQLTISDDSWSASANSPSFSTSNPSFSASNPSFSTEIVSPTVRALDDGSLRETTDPATVFPHVATEHRLEDSEQWLHQPSLPSPSPSPSPSGGNAGPHEANSKACWEMLSKATTLHSTPVLCTGSVLFCTALFLASNLTPSKELPQLFKSGVNLQQFLDLKNVNLTSQRHCDTCQAIYAPEFRCAGVSCPTGTCRYGICYSATGQVVEQCAGQMYQVSASCTLTSLQLLDWQTNARIAAGGGIVAILGLDGASSASANSVNCVDQYRDCNTWTRRRECDTNPEFMDQACPFSCRRCQGNNHAGVAAETGLQCFDGIDNDADGGYDCDDASCRNSILFCQMSPSQLHRLQTGLCAATTCMSALHSFAATCNNLQQRQAVQNLINYAH
jgi:hypothetical protein